jgi:hypothetical protein
MKKLFLLFALISTVQYVIAQKEKLELNLTPGETYYHIMNTRSVVEQELNGQQMKIDVTIGGRIAFKVVGSQDSLYSMMVSYEELTMTMKLPQGTRSFSSEKDDESDELSGILRTIKEKPFAVTMSRTGKIKQVKNLDTIFESIIQNASKLSETQKQQVRAQLQQAYGEKAFKGSFETVTAIYPRIPVAVGSTWVIKTNLESAMAATMTTVYTFKEKGDTYNLLVGKGEIETADKNAYVTSNGMPMKYNLTGEANSTIRIDNKTGWVLESKIVQTMSGIAEIKDNPKIPGGMKVPMTITSTMTYTSK